MSILCQRSFAGGEIAPALYARVDTVKYQTGLKTCRNFLVMRHGGVSNRPGTEFICEVSDSSRTVRLIPFVFNSAQTYMLEFGHLYIRVIRDGAQVTSSTKTISGATAANPIVVTATAHGFSNGDEVAISGVVGMTQLNNRNFKISSVATDTFSLTYMDGTDVDSSAFDAYTSGGSAEKIYSVTSPYIEEDLPELQYIQSADVITIVHPHYPPYQLSRTGHAAWTLTQIGFTPSIAAPANPATTGGTGSGTNSYQITAVASESLEESLPSSVTTIAKLAEAANPIAVTWDSVTGAQEYNVYKLSNGVYGFIGVAGSTSFSDVGITADTTDTPPNARDPFALASTKTITGITQASPAVVTSSAHGYLNGDLVYVADVVGMTQVNSKYFIAANVATNTFELTDLAGTNIDSSTYTAYSSAGTAQKANNFPKAVSYFQQRLVFASSVAYPERTWASRTGQFTNFTVSSPIQDDDAVTFTLAGRQVNEVRHIVDLGKLLVLTSGGEWAVEGDVAGTLKPTDVNPKQYSYNGASTLLPILIGGNVLYLQARGTIVRDLGYEQQVDGYNGNDLTIFAAHLFDKYSLVDWTYQQIPHSIVWGVRSDGTLLGLTYVRAHQLFGWHRHDFDGTAENVCSIPEGTEDSVYLVIKRSVDGATKRYIEKMYTRTIDDVVDTVIADCSLSYDGRNESSTHTMTLSGTTYAHEELLTLTSSASYFASTMVDDAIHLTGSDGTLIRFTIRSHTNATVVQGYAHKDVPAAMQAIATATWALALSQVTGLWHLEGKDVSVFADGFVVASPNNAAYVTRTVSNGTLTLDAPYSVIHVGLPITADISTLNIDSVQGDTMAAEKKNVQKLTLFLESSRGIFAGSEAPTDDDDDPLENLIELKIRSEEGYNDPVALKTGTADIKIRSTWNSNGSIFIRQVDPVPVSVLAIAPSGMFPNKG